MTSAASLADAASVDAPVTVPRPLAGQVALVTGATRGLGRTLAVALAGAGADIAVVGRDRTTGEATAAQVRAAGTRALVLPADVTDAGQIGRAAGAVIERFGRIDILLCAAGIGAARGAVWEADEADCRRIFDVNLFGTMLAMTAAMPGMIARGSGRVIVIGGTYGHKGVAGFGPYVASKWALRGLVKSAALEAGPHGVTVNIVAPGGIDGERLRAQFRVSAEARGESEAQVLARFTGGTALGRLVEEGDIAAAVLHLCGEGGRQITGQDLLVDSGTII